ncbi:putative allergen Ole e 1 [Helianthus anomalus]
MAGYAAILFLLSMATTAHCSWISGGAPPPVKAGDYVPLGDDLLDIPSPVSEPGSNDALALEEIDYAAYAAAAAGSGGEGKGSTTDMPAANGEKRILQEKETSKDMFIIQGKVYCDPCRIQIPTKISYPLAGTKVSLVCHKADTDEESYRVDGESDAKGKYRLEAVGDHAEEICEIVVSESPDPNCPELMDDENHVKVSLTNKHGLKGKGRYANPLGFMASDADPRCKEALDELGFTGI